MKQTNYVTRREASPLIWGAWGAIIAAAIVAAAAYFGEAIPQTVGQAAAGGFFWLWAMASIKNWLGRGR
jgi:hypothetical protein